MTTPTVNPDIDRKTPLTGLATLVESFFPAKEQYDRAKENYLRLGGDAAAGALASAEHRLAKIRAELGAWKLLAGGMP